MCPLNPKQVPLPSPEQGGWGDTDSAAAPPPTAPGERVQGQLQAFTSLMASMRRALLVTAVVRKMNLYPEDQKHQPGEHQQISGPQHGPHYIEPLHSWAGSKNQFTGSGHSDWPRPGTGLLTLQPTASATQRAAENLPECCPLQPRARPRPAVTLPFSLTFLSAQEPQG